MSGPSTDLPLSRLPGAAPVSSRSSRTAPATSRQSGVDPRVRQSGEPDVVHILDPGAVDRSRVFTNRPITFQAFRLKHGEDDIAEDQTKPSIKLEPGVTQPLPTYDKPLKLEIQDNYIDSGRYTATNKKYKRTCKL